MKTKPMLDRSNKSLSSALILLTTFLIMIGATYLFFSLEADFTNFRAKRLSTTIGTIFLYIATGVLLYKALFFIYTLYCYFRYKAIPSVSDGELPTRSEERRVGKSVELGGGGIVSNTKE